MPNANDLRRAKALARELEGGRYRMGAVSRGASDCSGLMSIVLNSLQGRENVYVRRFATGNLRDNAARLGLRKGLGDGNDFNLGVMYPWESRSGIGHVAGTLAGLNVESRGGRGVLLGARARGATSTLFRHHFHLPIDGTKTGAPPPRQPKRLLQPYPGHMHVRGGVAHGHVRLIQQRLNAIAGRGGHDVLGGKLLQATGTFGSNTERIVKRFQGHRGMEEDGIVGPLTWARLFRR